MTLNKTQAMFNPAFNRTRGGGSAMGTGLYGDTLSMKRDSMS